MAFVADHVEGVLNLSETDTPPFLQQHPGLLNKTHSLFSSFITSSDGTSMSNGFILIATALLLQPIQSDHPVGVQGKPRLHAHDGGLEWEILVEAVDFQPFSADPYKHASVGKIRIRQRRVVNTLPDVDPLLVAQTWVVELHDNPGTQYWLTHAPWNPKVVSFLLALSGKVRWFQFRGRWSVQPGGSDEARHLFEWSEYCGTGDWSTETTSISVPVLELPSDDEEIDGSDIRVLSPDTRESSVSWALERPPSSSSSDSGSSMSWELSRGPSVSSNLLPPPAPAPANRNVRPSRLRRPVDRFTIKASRPSLPLSVQLPHPMPGARPSRRRVPVTHYSPEWSGPPRRRR